MQLESAVLSKKDKISDRQRVDQGLANNKRDLEQFRSSPTVVIYHRRKLPGGGQYLLSEEIPRETESP